MLIKFKARPRQIDHLLKKYKDNLTKKTTAIEKAKQELIEIFVKECQQAMNDKEINLKKIKFKF